MSNRTLICLIIAAIIGIVGISVLLFSIKDKNNQIVILNQNIEKYKAEEQKLLQDKEILQSRITSLEKDIQTERDLRSEELKKFIVIKNNEDHEKIIIRDMDAVSISRKLTERAAERRSKQRNGNINP